MPLGPLCTTLEVPYDPLMKQEKVCHEEKSRYCYRCAAYRRSDAPQPTRRQLMVAGGLDRATPVSAAMAMAAPSPMRVMATGVAMDSTVGTRGPAATCMPIAIIRTAASGPFAGDSRHSSLS